MRDGLSARLLVGALLFALGSCDALTSPNFNAGDFDEVTTNPTPASMATTIQGLMIGARAYQAPPNGYIVLTGIIGREGYNLDPADPRFVTEMLAAPELNPGSGGFGGNIWDAPYANLRLADIALRTVEAVEGVAEGDKEAARGFIKTIMALDLLHIVNTRDMACGCPIEVPEGVEPAPEVGKEQVFDRIVQLLDEGRGHLQAGTAFPFRLSNGFDGFDTPATFLTFNRALRARVAIYREDWNGALEALAASFLDPDGDLDVGPFHEYGTGSGDQTNGIFTRASGTDPNIRIHPSVETEAQAKADGSLDDRFTRKTQPLAEFRDFGGTVAGSEVGFTVYNSLTAPVPIIRNEELILLRAEANIHLGDLGTAEADINRIRERSGGLEPMTLTSEAQAIDVLLRERFYSLLFEGGHRWLDARRYDRLDQLPKDFESHRVHPFFPVPLPEVLGRQ